MTRSSLIPEALKASSGLRSPRLKMPSGPGLLMGLASARAEAPAWEASTAGLSMPTRETWRSVTRARPRAPRMSPRSGVSEETASVSPGSRLGSTRVVAQAACHSSSASVRGAVTS